MRSESRLQVFLLAIVIAALAISAVSPADRVTWLMEVLPVMVAIHCCSPPAPASR